MNYIHEILSALSRNGMDVELWVPGPAPHDWLPSGIAPPPYRVCWIDAGYPAYGDPGREARYRFCRAVNDAALARAQGSDAPDVLHVLFGLFLMEVLATDRLRAAGLPSVATVHNVPPHECRLVADNAPLCERLKEDARLWVVGWKNRVRLRAQHWDELIVPSEQVRDLLASVLPKQEITVIGHGPTSELSALMRLPVSRRPCPDRPVRLLTVGGFAPHKRQHLIPDVAELLSDRGLEFEWDVVGPAGRVAGYFDAVCHAASRANLSDKLRIRAEVPFAELAALYDAANLYVQPSVEEGFCITALDAAAAGLPVIASPAGALARIARASNGAVVESAPAPLAEAIYEFVSVGLWGDAGSHVSAVQTEFSWNTSALTLEALYTALMKKTAQNHSYV